MTAPATHRRTLLVSSIALLALLLAAGCGKKEGTVEGTVTAGGAAVAGEVNFFVQEGDERTGTPFLTVKTDGSGSFRAALPPGQYHVVARATRREDGRTRSYKGEYGGNPVRLLSGGTVKGVAVAVSEMSSGGFAPREGTGAQGTVLSGGKGAPGVFVYAYPAAAGTVRGPSWVAFARTDPSGRFRLPLREGEFRLVARRKGGDDETGAMGPSGASGGGSPVSVSPGRIVDAGAIVLHAPEEALRRERAARGGQEAAVAEVRGTVARDDGTPVAGVRVMAYADRRMIGRPFAISGPTGTDGAFVLRLSRGGTFHLGARSGSGGPLSPGEWVGSWDGRPDHGMEVAAGEKREGVRIAVVEKW
jgi:hypothetical protein